MSSIKAIQLPVSGLYDPWLDEERDKTDDATLNDIHDLLVLFYSYPPLLHHLCVALIQQIGVDDTSKAAYHKITIPLQIFSCEFVQQVKLFSGPWPDLDESIQMPGYLRIGKVILGDRVKDSTPGGYSTILNGIKEAARQDGMGNDPVVIVTFTYLGREMPIGLMLSKEAFETARGSPAPDNLQLPVRSSLEPPPQRGKMHNWEQTTMGINQYIVEDTDNKLRLRARVKEDDKDVR